MFLQKSVDDERHKRLVRSFELFSVHRPGPVAGLKRPTLIQEEKSCYYTTYTEVSGYMYKESCLIIKVYLKKKTVTHYKF